MSNRCVYNLPRIVLTAVLGVTLAASAAWAQEPAPATQPTTQPAQPTTQPTTQPGKEPNRLAGGKESEKDYLADDDGAEIRAKAFAAILVILVLGGVAIFVVKKVRPRLIAKSGRRILIEETAYLAPGKTIHIVSVDGQKVLLASSKDRISMLTKLEAGADESPEEIA